jgi:TolB-like protein/Tfp pilus assembly protein PilF
MSGRPKARYEFGPFYLDATEQLLSVDGKPIQLTPKVFDTLVILVENSGHVIGKDEFLERLWPDTNVEEGNLAVNISALRRALDAAGERPVEYIETVRGRGYRFLGKVRALPPRQPEAAGAARAADGRDGAAEVIDSLAVLPLVNASGEPNAEYLSDGITESIINTLSQLPQLRVMARSTVFRFKGYDNPLDAGRELGVRSILTGRVRQFGDSLIISAELVEVSDGVQIWGDQYNRKPSDIFAVQEEISREISEKLRLKLSGEQKRRLAKRYTDNADAYQTYLKGRFYWNKRTLENLLKGVGFFERAIEIDANYALAFSGLADSYLLLGSVEYGALNPTEAMQKAKHAATTALRLDSALAEARASLAYVKIFDWDWDGAETEYRQAIELNPSYATAYHWYALFLTAMGRREEALAMIERACKLDPLSLPINVGVGLHFYLARRYGRAIEEYSKTLELDPNFYMAHFGLAMAYEQNGMFVEAIEAYGRAIELSGGSPLMRAGIGHAYAMSGQKREAQRVLDELRKMNEQTEQKHLLPYFLAAIYAGLGEKDEAFRSLETACQTRSEGLMWIKVDPALDNLRSDPRFENILRRVRLAP